MNDAQAQRRRWLPLSWKVMAAFGIFYISLAVFVPFQSYFTLPNQPMIVFGPTDEKFTSLSWKEIMGFSPDLGLWIVLSMVSMCAMMMIAGVLTLQISRRAYREGQRWAWVALLVGNGVSLAYYVVFIGGIHLARGLPFWTQAPGSSGFGADWIIIVTIVWLYLGLWLPRKEFHD